METKPFSLQAPEQIAKDYGGNKQKIAQAMQSGIVDPTAALMAGMFIDRMRSAQAQEQAPQQNVAQEVFNPQPQQMAQNAPPAGLGAGPPGMPQNPAIPNMPTQRLPQAPAQRAPMPAQPMASPNSAPGFAGGGLAALPIPDEMFDSYSGGGLVAFAEGGATELIAEKKKELARTRSQQRRYQILQEIAELERNSLLAERQGMRDVPVPGTRDGFDLSAMQEVQARTDLANQAARNRVTGNMPEAPRLIPGSDIFPPEAPRLIPGSDIFPPGSAPPPPPPSLFESLPGPNRMPDVELADRARNRTALPQANTSGPYLGSLPGPDRRSDIELADRARNRTPLPASSAPEGEAYDWQAEQLRLAEEAETKAKDPSLTGAERDAQLRMAFNLREGIAQGQMGSGILRGLASPFKAVHSYFSTPQGERQSGAAPFDPETMTGTVNAGSFPVNVAGDQGLPMQLTSSAPPPPSAEPPPVNLPDLGGGANIVPSAGPADAPTAAQGVTTPEDYLARLQAGDGMPKRPDAVDLSKMKKEDMWQMLAQIGFGMAGSKSPTLLGAVGEAGTAAMPGAIAARKDRRALEQSEREAGHTRDVAEWQSGREDMRTAFDLSNRDEDRALRREEGSLDRDAAWRTALHNGNVQKAVASFYASRPTEAERIGSSYLRSQIAKGDKRHPDIITHEGITKKLQAGDAEAILRATLVEIGRNMDFLYDPEARQLAENEAWAAYYSATGGGTGDTDSDTAPTPGWGEARQIP